MEQKELNEKVKLHGEWVKDYSKGERLNLHDANLHKANLHGANLYKANLRYTDLYGANLHRANLYRANLHRANLYIADLYGADLYEANLYEANLYGANLHGANLRYADLRYADLRYANLNGADLHYANLRYANLRYANLPNFKIIPDAGTKFIVYKKLANNCICKMLVPSFARRTNSLIGRKIRIECGIVLEIKDSNGKLTNDKITNVSFHKKLEYQTGKMIFEKEYNPDIRIECTDGIHCFLTEKEAKEW